MESILHFVLFREEELMMLCQGDFEQQKQRFHMSTINFLEMLPDQPRNKLLETASGLQSRCMPSCFDKENLVGSQTVSNASVLKCPGTRGRNSQALGDMDSNILSNMSSGLLQNPCIRMANIVSPRAGNSFQKAIPLQSGLSNRSASQDEDRCTRVECGLGIIPHIPVGGSVKVEDDEGAGRMLCDPAPEKDVYTLPQGNARNQGRQRDIVARIPRAEIFEVLDDPKIAIVERVQEARTDGILKETKGRREGEKGNNELGIHEAEIHNRTESCQSQQVEIRVSEEMSLSSCRRVGTRRGKKAAVLATAALPQASKRVTRSSARQSETVLQTQVATTAQQEPTHEPARKKTTRGKAKQVAAIMPPLVEEAGGGVTNDKPGHMDSIFNIRSEGIDSVRGGHDVEDTLISIEAMQIEKTHEETCQGFGRLHSIEPFEGTQSQNIELSQQGMTEELPSKKICRRLVGSAAFPKLQLKDPEVRTPMDKLEIRASDESRAQTSGVVTTSAVSLQLQNVTKMVSSDKFGDWGIIVEAGIASSAGKRSQTQEEDGGLRRVQISDEGTSSYVGQTVSLSASPVVEVRIEPLPCIQMSLPKRQSRVVALHKELEGFEPIIAVADTDNTKLFHISEAGRKSVSNGCENVLENPTGKQGLVHSGEGQEGSCKAARKSFLIRNIRELKESQAAPSLQMARESSEEDARVNYDDCRRDQVSSGKLSAPRFFKSTSVDATHLHLYEYGDHRASKSMDFSTPSSDDETPESGDLRQVSFGKQASVSGEKVPTGKQGLVHSGEGQEGSFKPARELFLIRNIKASKESQTGPSAVHSGEGQEGSFKAARESFLIRNIKASKESQTGPSLQMARESSEEDAWVHYDNCRRDQVSSGKLSTLKMSESPSVDATNLRLQEYGDQFSTPRSHDGTPDCGDLQPVSFGKQASVSGEKVLKIPESNPPKSAFNGNKEYRTPLALSKVPENEEPPSEDGRLALLEHEFHPEVTLTFDRFQSPKRLSARSARESSEEDAWVMNDEDDRPDQVSSGKLSAPKLFESPTVGGTNLPIYEYGDHTASKSMNICTLSSDVETFECGNLQQVSIGKQAGVSGEKVLKSPETDPLKLAINKNKQYTTPLALLKSPLNEDSHSGEGRMSLLEQEFHPEVTLTLDQFQYPKRLSARSARESPEEDARVMNDDDYRPYQVSSGELSAPKFFESPPVDGTNLPSYDYDDHTAFESLNISTPSSEDETPPYGNLQQVSLGKQAGVSGEKVLKNPEIDPPKWVINEDKEHKTPLALWKLPENEGPPSGEGRMSLLEQEFHPEVTLTLDRFQFRKRLSARSRARARRWKSDVAVKGKDDGQGQPIVALPTSPCRDVSLKEELVELVESGMDLQTPRALQEARLLLPGVVEAVQQIVVSQKPGEIPCSSMATLHYEPSDQVFQDGEGNGVNSQECPFMDVDNEQHESLSSSPLLQSIYTLSRVCENGMASGKDFLKEMESQQVQSLIAIANQIITQLSSKKGQQTRGMTKTPTSSHSMLHTSDTVSDPFSPYPVRSDLFSPGPDAYSVFPESSNCLSPYPVGSSSRAADNPSEPIVTQLSNPMSNLPVSSLQAFVEPVLPSGLSATAEKRRSTKSLGLEDALIASAAGRQENGSLGSEAMGCQSSDHVSPDERITFRSGAPLSSQIPHQEQPRVVLSHLRSRLFGKGEDANIGSAVVNEASDDLTSRLEIVRNPAVQQDCCESPETLDCPAEYGSNLLSGGKRSGLKVSNSYKEALTQEPEPRTAVDELHVGVWNSFSASVTQVHTGAAPASFVNNLWQEMIRITPSSKEAFEGSVRLVDGGGFQIEERPLTRTSLLTSPTTLEIKHAGGGDITPSSTKGTSMQIRRCCQPTVFLSQESPVVLSLESGLQTTPAERASILEVAISRADELKVQSNSTISHQNLSDSKPVRPEKENVEEVSAHQYSCGPPETLIPRVKVVDNAAVLGDVHMLESLKSYIPGQPAAPTPAQSQGINASIQSVQTQCPSNLRGVEFCANPSGSTIPRSNLIASMRSFIPLVHQQQPATPYPNGKRDVKVRALEAAEAARREAEQRELEKQERKKAMVVARREKAERAAQEKKKPGTELQDEDPRKAALEATKKKAVLAGTTKSLLLESSNNPGTTIQGVHLKVKRAMDSKSKMEQDKLEKLQEEQRRKEEEWKRKEAEAAVRKRKQEHVEKKEREVKRKRQEDAIKMHREMEERQRADLQEKFQKRRALEESEKERKAMEEEIRRQKRMDKEKEGERRRKEEMGVKAAWLVGKEATRKRKEETARQMKEFEEERQHQAVKLVRMSGNPAISGNGPFRSFMSTMRLASSVGDATGVVPVTGANQVEGHRPTSQSLLGPPMRVPRTTAEGTGAVAIPGSKLQAERTRSNSQGLLRPAIRVPRITIEGMGAVALPGSKVQAERTRSNSQGFLGPAIRVPRITTEGATSGCILIAGSGQFLPLEAVTNSVLGSCAAPYCGGAVPAASGLSERINLLHSQPGSQNVGSLVAVASKGVGPAPAGTPGPRFGVIAIEDTGLQSYDISPFRDSSDDDSEDENKRPQKMIPQWARKENLMVQLVRQLQQDPDELFASATSCTLDEVFETTGSKKRPDFRRRGSSGDWVQDHLTWQEEIRYKTTMGYLH